MPIQVISDPFVVYQYTGLPCTDYRPSKRIVSLEHNIFLRLNFKKLLANLLNPT